MAMPACPAFVEAASRRQAKRHFGVQAWATRSSRLRTAVSPFGSYLSIDLKEAIPLCQSIGSKEDGMF